MTSKKKEKITAFLFMMGAFFKTKVHFKHHFAQIFPYLARKELNKNMTSEKKKTSAPSFWVPFL